jgi:hypothetical protein
MSQLFAIAKPPLKKCAGCGNEGASFKHCSGCLSVFYCSSACQSTSWAGHKAACKQIRLLRIKEEKEKSGSGVGDVGSNKGAQKPMPQSQRYEDQDIAKACLGDHREELQRVLRQSGLDANWAEPTTGTTAALLAVWNGHGECLLMIIQYGADLSKTDKAGLAPIHGACRYGRIACLAILLDHGVGVNVRTASANGLTPVLYCSGAGHVKCLALLLDRKADTDLADSYGTTAIHYACMSGELKCLQLLVARRANINAKNALGQTPLDIARLFRNSKCAELLLENHAVGMRVEDIYTPSEAEMVRPAFVTLPSLVMPSHRTLQIFYLGRKRGDQEKCRGRP